MYLPVKVGFLYTDVIKQKSSFSSSTSRQSTQLLISFSKVNQKERCREIKLARTSLQPSLLLKIVKVSTMYRQYIKGLLTLEKFGFVIPKKDIDKCWVEREIHSHIIKLTVHNIIKTKFN